MTLHTLTSNKIIMGSQLILKSVPSTSNEITKYGCLKLFLFCALVLHYFLHFDSFIVSCMCIVHTLYKLKFCGLKLVQVKVYKVIIYGLYGLS
jgi:hypothetical protein